MNKEVIEELRKQKPRFYMLDIRNYNEDFLIDIIEWQYQMLKAYEDCKKDELGGKDGD